MTTIPTFARRTLLLCLLPAFLAATDTRTWLQGSASDFEKGVIKNLSVRSDGVLMLAPASRELFDSATPYLWALARDSKGNLYAGGGPQAKLFAIAPDSKARVLATFDEMEIHAIAIDSRDRVYAATSPDGKVYRVAQDGKSEVFYDPKAKYIWAMAFDPKGDLLVATGDRGEIHRVSPNGSGRVFFRTDESHVRSLAIDAAGNVIAGTDPAGLVIRVSPAGEGFVLFQLPKREVTAVAVARDGAIYAAGIGNRQAPAPQPTPQQAPAPAGTPSVQINVSAPQTGGGSTTPRPAAPTAPAGPPSGIAGGSEVYRIDPDGNPRRVWSHAQDVVYAIAFDPAGKPVIGAGNRGNIYRIESQTVYTQLLSLPATQITAFQNGRDGSLYAASANVGKVYEVGPAVEREGTVESDVFDASVYSLWGRLGFEARLNGGKVSVSTRTGNLDSPQRNWSPWSAPVTDQKGVRITSPAARFVQWRATLTPGPGNAGVSPELEWVEVAYLQKNIEPRVDEIEMTPPNYRFPTVTISVGQTQQTLSLPAMGRRPAVPAATSSTSSPENTTTTPTMQLSKGAVGARWLASDPNGDAMVYTVEIRGVNETQWKLLKDKVSEKYISWDSTAFPDGEYLLRVTASDAPGNPPSEALTARTESDPFIIDNTPPRITGLSAARSGGKLEVKWHAADALNIIVKAEYSLDGGDWTVAAPVGRLSDSLELDYALTLDAATGEHTVAVRVRDDYDNEAAEKVVVPAQR
jgi:sugar lactone lactonase YvrE